MCPSFGETLRPLLALALYVDFTWPSYDSAVQKSKKAHSSLPKSPKTAESQWDKAGTCSPHIRITRRM